VRYSQRLADNEIVASVGSKCDSFENAMAESFNGLYKWELIHPKGPWRGLDDVEFATLTYVCPVPRFLASQTRASQARRHRRQRSQLLDYEQAAGSLLGVRRPREPQKV
jgi:transposase InsO family protein